MSSASHIPVLSLVGPARPINSANSANTSVHKNTEQPFMRRPSCDNDCRYRVSSISNPLAFQFICATSPTRKITKGFNKEEWVSNYSFLNFFKIIFDVALNNPTGTKPVTGWIRQSMIKNKYNGDQYFDFKELLKTFELRFHALFPEIKNTKNTAEVRTAIYNRINNFRDQVRYLPFNYAKDFPDAPMNDPNNNRVGGWAEEADKNQDRESYMIAAMCPSNRIAQHIRAHDPTLVIFGPCYARWNYINHRAFPNLRALLLRSHYAIRHHANTADSHLFPLTVTSAIIGTSYFENNGLMGVIDDYFNGNFTALRNISTVLDAHSGYQPPANCSTFLRTLTTDEQQSSKTIHPQGYDVATDSHGTPCATATKDIEDKIKNNAPISMKWKIQSEFAMGSKNFYQVPKLERVTIAGIPLSSIDLDIPMIHQHRARSQQREYCSLGIPPHPAHSSQFIFHSCPLLKVVDVCFIRIDFVQFWFVDCPCLVELTIKIRSAIDPNTNQEREPAKATEIINSFINLPSLKHCDISDLTETTKSLIGSFVNVGRLGQQFSSLNFNSLELCSDSMNAVSVDRVNLGNLHTVNGRSFEDSDIHLLFFNTENVAALTVAFDEYSPLVEIDDEGNKDLPELFHGMRDVHVQQYQDREQLENEVDFLHRNRLEVFMIGPTTPTSELSLGLASAADRKSAQDARQAQADLAFRNHHRQDQYDNSWNQQNTRVRSAPASPAPSTSALSTQAPSTQASPAQAPSTQASTPPPAPKKTFFLQQLRAQQAQRSTTPPPPTTTKPPLSPAPGTVLVATQPTPVDPPQLAFPVSGKSTPSRRDREEEPTESTTEDDFLFEDDDGESSTGIIIKLGTMTMGGQQETFPPPF